MADYPVLGASYNYLPMAANYLQMAVSTVTLRVVVGGTVGEKRFVTLRSLLVRGLERKWFPS